MDVARRFLSSKRILLVHQSLQPGGGANAVAAWVVEALQDHFDLTILAWDPFDAEALNRFFGTSIRTSDISIILPPPVLRWLRRLDPDEGSLIPMAYLMRVAHRIRERYALVIGTATEELDLGGPGLLYIHHPDLGRFWQKYRDCGGKPLHTKLHYLITGRTRPWMALSDYSVDRLKGHTVLANSDWTGARVESIYGIRSRTLYPPVPMAQAQLPWEERENAFVAAGRFNRRKRLDWIVRLLGKVRERQHDLELHLLGTRETVGDSPAHYRELQSLVIANSDWITIHADVSRNEYLNLLGRVKYGIHAQIDEHFGIAPAEMLMAGCIPFVHASGGQVEISGRDERLCFTSEEDAVEKISAVIQNSTLQQVMRTSLARRRQLFSTERFVNDFRGFVEELTTSTPTVHSLPLGGSRT